jgi:hypothetical protein
MTDEEQERMLVIAANAAALSDLYGEEHQTVKLLHEALAALAAESVRRRLDNDLD